MQVHAVKSGRIGQDVNKARLAQSVERLALNQVVVGSSPTVGAPFVFCAKFFIDFPCRLD